MRENDLRSFDGEGNMRVVKMLYSFFPGYDNVVHHEFFINILC